MLIPAAVEPVWRTMGTAIRISAPMDVKPSLRRSIIVVPVGLHAQHSWGKRRVVSKAHPINTNALFTVPQGFGTVMGTKAAKPQVVLAKTVMTTPAIYVQPACPNFEPLLIATTIPRMEWLHSLHALDLAIQKRAGLSQLLSGLINLVGLSRFACEFA
jgi:hypothetical protein